MGSGLASLAVVFTHYQLMQRTVYTLWVAQWRSDGVVARDPGSILTWGAVGVEFVRSPRDRVDFSWVLQFPPTLHCSQDRNLGL